MGWGVRGATTFQPSKVQSVLWVARLHCRLFAKRRVSVTSESETMGPHGSCTSSLMRLSAAARRGAAPSGRTSANATTVATRRCSTTAGGTARSPIQSSSTATWARGAMPCSSSRTRCVPTPPCPHPPSAKHTPSQATNATTCARHSVLLNPRVQVLVKTLLRRTKEQCADSLSLPPRKVPTLHPIDWFRGALRACPCCPPLPRYKPHNQLMDPHHPLGLVSM